MKKVIESKFIFFFTTIAFFSILIPKLLNLLLSAITKKMVNQWISYLVFIGLLSFICLVFEIIKFGSKSLKRERTIDAVVKIKELNKKYVYQDVDLKKQKTLFSISEGEEELAESLLNKKYKPVIMYSLSVKDYLNWIDFCFFSYLRDLRLELDCEIIIVLHPDSKTRLQFGSEAELEKETSFKWYSRIIKSIIGKVIIMNEDDVYKQNPNDYAVNFHSFYISQILNYANKLCGVDNDKEKSELFGSYLGYIESVFSVEQYAKKYVNTKQLFVLDRKNSQKIWSSSEKLINFKSQNHFIFIGSETITNEKNEKINVYDKNSILCLTENNGVSREKLASCDSYTLMVIYQLLCASDHKRIKNIIIPRKEEICDAIIEKINYFINLYHLNPYEGGVL